MQLPSIFTLVFMFLLPSDFFAQSTIAAFASTPQPPAPDYAVLDSWAAHPDKEDKADMIPRPLRKMTTDLATKVDVFFLHPTIFTETPEDKYVWNAALSNDKMNKEVDNSTIKLQASIFNQAGKIYAPRYRQAHLRSFFNPHTKEGDKALALAYEDVKKAFLYYLEHNNNNRPFILAGHSQGSRHLKQLMKELVDGKDLQKQLVAAYIVGWGVDKETFEHIPLGTEASQTGCYLTWRTYNKGYVPEWIAKNDACVNPLTWTAESTYADYKQNDGAILRNLNIVRKRLFDAEVHGPVLWVGKPNIIFGKLLQRNNYHVGDYNLFYLNVRKNAILRAESYLKAREQ